MAAQLGLIIYTALDSSGNPVSGAAIDVRKQGATVQSGSNPYTVDDAGAITSSPTDTVELYDAAGVRAGVDAPNVNAVAATSITTSAGFASAPGNNYRISPTTNKHTLYADAQGNEVKTNPLTTDSNGLAYAYAPVGLYDIKQSGGTSVLGAGPTLFTRDYPTVGGGRFRQNPIGASATPLYEYDTFRTLLSADLHSRWLNNGTVLARLFGDGSARLAAGLTIDSGGINVAGNSQINGTLTGLSQVDSTSLRAGTSPATVIDQNRDLQIRRLRPIYGTGLANGDFAISAGWGTTASVSLASGSDTSGTIAITSSGTGQTANPTVTFTFKDGAYSGFLTFVPVRYDSSAPTTGFWGVQAQTTTTVTFIFFGTPVAGNTYALRWHAM